MNNKSAAAKVLEQLAGLGGASLDMGALSKMQKGAMAHTQEANSVLRSLHKPHAYTKKNCKRETCKQVFETNYCSMAYCSDDCLAADMRDIGIVWDPFKMKRHESHMFSSDSNVLWRYEPPEYISTQTLNALEPVLREWLADLDRLRSIAQAVEIEQTDQMLLSLGVEPLSEEAEDDETEPSWQPNPLPRLSPSAEQEYEAPTSLPLPPPPADIDWSFLDGFGN